MSSFELPEGINYGIDVSPLANAFSNVRNSYKFFFFLSLLDWFGNEFRSFSELKIDIDWIARRMASNAWYPAVYYGLSLGSQDGLGKKLLELRNTLTSRGVRFTIAPQDALRMPEAEELQESFRVIAGRYVPYRFIRPFFAQELAQKSKRNVHRDIFDRAAECGDGCPYRIFGTASRATAVEISPPWAAYLLTHQAILREWTHLHLCRYLARLNPFAVEIPQKVDAPQRKALKAERNLVAAVVKFHLVKGAPIRCIYSDKEIEPNQFELDHFLPRAFVAHDRFWNLVPADPGVNSSKLASIPDDEYLPKLTAFHRTSIGFLLTSSLPKQTVSSFLMQYENDLALGVDEGTPSESTLLARYEGTVLPLMRTARVYGFPEGWRYDLA